MYDVVDWEEDAAGKFRYRVIVSGRTVMFKFQEQPSFQDVQDIAASYDAMMQEQASVRDAIMQEQADAAPVPE